MKILNLLKIATRSLRRNVVRSLLTMLGIIIGVASVIAMTAIGQGSKSSIQSQIAGLGTNMIIVFPGAVQTGGVRMDAGSSVKLSMDDAKGMLARCPSLMYVSPVARSGAQVIANGQNWRTSVWGGNVDYFKIRNLDLVSGNVFSDLDDRNSGKVCVLGQTVVTNLFGEGVDPVGQDIRVRSIPFKVVGVLTKKGQNAFGQDQDDIVIAPFSTVQNRMVNSTAVQQIMASAKTEELIPQGSSEINDYLRLQHKLGPNEDDDFTVRTQTDLATMASSTSQIMTVLLVVIASISLIVGGIGIMNIMLVTVTERTREIGIRMAVGAKGREILTQFLIEAVFISLMGGAIGIVLGIGISILVGQFAGWPVSVTTNSILLSFGFSSLTGVFFGFYPARKASQLNPIDALRYE